MKEFSKDQTSLIKAVCRLFCTGLMLFLLAPALHQVVMPAPVWGGDPAMPGLPECPDGELQDALGKGYNAGKAAGVAAALEFTKSATKAQAKDPIKFPFGDLGKVLCIDKLILYFDIIRALVSGAEWLEVILAALIAKIFNEICEYVVSSILATVNNALNSLCVSLPDFSFSLDLPSVETQSCDGISLADAMSVSVVKAKPISLPISKDFLSAPLSRWIQSTGLTDGSVTYDADKGTITPKF